MVWSWCHRSRDKSVKLTAALVLFATLGMTPELAAQSVPASEREALVKLRVDRGGQAEDVDALIRQADEAAAKGLPSAPLTNKIREGLAKGHDPKRIEPVVRQMRAQLETADQLMREFDATAAGPARDASLSLLAESLGGGVTANDVRELQKQAQAPGRPSLTSDGLANAAKGLSFITEAKLPVTEGTALVAEAVRQGFRAHEVLELGREIKRRERDFIAGRSTLRDVRAAIARGDRPEQLFRDRVEPVERPAATRPATPERPERPAQPERPARPERPERPERPASRQ